MPRYFFDLDTGDTRYVDIFGTELAHKKMVPKEAIGFLATVFKDSTHDGVDRVFVVSVRDEVGVVYTTTLTLQSNGLDTASGKHAMPIISNLELDG